MLVEERRVKLERVTQSIDIFMMMS